MSPSTLTEPLIVPLQVRFPLTSMVQRPPSLSPLAIRTRLVLFAVELFPTKRVACGELLKKLPALLSSAVPTTPTNPDSALPPVSPHTPGEPPKACSCCWRRMPPLTHRYRDSDLQHRSQLCRSRCHTRRFWPPSRNGSKTELVEVPMTALAEELAKIVAFTVYSR